jgi:hypothetical protein
LCAIRFRGRGQECFGTDFNKSILELKEFHLRNSIRSVPSTDTRTDTA